MRKDYAPRCVKGRKKPMQPRFWVSKEIWTCMASKRLTKGWKLASRAFTATPTLRRTRDASCRRSLRKRKNLTKTMKGTKREGKNMSWKERPKSKKRSNLTTYLKNRIWSYKSRLLQPRDFRVPPSTVLSCWQLSKLLPELMGRSFRINRSRQDPWLPMHQTVKVYILQTKNYRRITMTLFDNTQWLPQFHSSDYPISKNRCNMMILCHKNGSAWLCLHFAKVNKIYLQLNKN